MGFALHPRRTDWPDENILLLPDGLPEWLSQGHLGKVLQGCINSVADGLVKDTLHPAHQHLQAFDHGNYLKQKLKPDVLACFPLYERSVDLALRESGTNLILGLIVRWLIFLMLAALQTTRWREHLLLFLANGLCPLAGSVSSPDLLLSLITHNPWNLHVLHMWVPLHGLCRPPSIPWHSLPRARVQWQLPGGSEPQN